MQKRVANKLYYYIGYSVSENGRSKPKSCYGGKTKEAALKKLKQIELALLDGQTPLPKRPSGACGGQTGEYVNLFKKHLETAVAASTRKLYERNLDRFLAWSNVATKPLESITPALLEEYKLTRKNAAYDTKCNDLTCLRSFFAWLNRLDYYEANPMKKVHIKKPEKNKPPDFLSKEEITNFLELAKDKPRDYALFTLMLNTGLRSAEVRSLKWKDLDFARKKLTVKGKGSKYRTVPLSDCAVKALDKLRRVATWVFMTRAGKPFNRHSIRMLFERYSGWLGRKVHPHLLRHTFATHLMASCKNPVIVKEILGHADLRTTMIYSHVNLDMLAGAVDGLYG